MSERVLPKIESIEIDPEGRYILLVEGLDTEAVRELADALLAWRESDEKILVLYASPSQSLEFHIERVGEW